MNFTSVVGGVIKGVSWDCMIFKDMHLSHVYIIREYPAKHLRQVPSATEYIWTFVQGRAGGGVEGFANCEVELPSSGWTRRKQRYREPLTEVQPYPAITLRSPPMAIKSSNNFFSHFIAGGRGFVFQSCNGALSSWKWGVWHEKDFDISRRTTIVAWNDRMGCAAIELLSSFFSGNTGCNNRARVLQN